MSWPAVLLWTFLAAGLVLPGSLLLYVFALATVFGTLQMMPSDVNLIPASLSGGCLVLRFALRRGNIARMLEVAIDPRQGAVITLFVLYALSTAVILPGVFAGSIEVIAISGASVGASLLGPSSGNVTQSCYLLASYCVVLAFAVLGRRRAMQVTFLRMTVVYGLGLVASGVADLVSYRLGQGGVLEPFRTASYRLLTDVESIDIKRVVGLQPEASVYGSLCVSAAALLALLRPCCPTARLRVLAGITALVLVVMAALSTSAAAYGGLAVFAAVYALNWMIRARSRHPLHPGAVRVEAGLIAVAVLAGAGVAVFQPQLLASAYRIVDVMVLQKSSSSSYIERSLWNEIGWRAFLESGGLGVGYGSLRTSNWFIAILGCTGVLGGLLLFGFIAILLVLPVRTVDPFAREMVRGLRLALVPTYAMNWLAGTIPDIGVWSACHFGMLVAVLDAANARSEVHAAQAVAPARVLAEA